MRKKDNVVITTASHSFIKQDTKGRYIKELSNLKKGRGAHIEFTTTEGALRFIFYTNEFKKI